MKEHPLILLLLKNFIIDNFSLSLFLIITIIINSQKLTLNNDYFLITIILWLVELELKNICISFTKIQEIISK